MVYMSSYGTDFDNSGIASPAQGAAERVPGIDFRLVGQLALRS